LSRIAALSLVSIEVPMFEPNKMVLETIAEDLSERVELKLVSRSMTYYEYLGCLFRPGADLVYSLIQPPPGCP
jgi:hypothetical protein